MLDALAIAVLQKVVGEFLREVQLDASAVKLGGMPLDKSFTIQFQGTPGIAAARVNKFFQLQKGPDGWRDIRVPNSPRLRPLPCAI